MSDSEINQLQQVKMSRRISRLQDLGYQNATEIDANRDPCVSIGIFGCGRFNLLHKTCSSLSAFLGKHGEAFPHEVLFFHDGPDPEIELWASDNPLFDRVFFNRTNLGLSRNINRFWFEESKGRYLLNLEDDWICQFQGNFILDAIDILESDSNIGCVRMERKFPRDYRRWDEAFKIGNRVMSRRVFDTANRHHAYRVLEEQDSPEGIYANACVLVRFSAVAIAGKLRDDFVRRRDQEPEYMKAFNCYWEGARGIRQEDSPFLHIGDGKSVPAWKN